MITHAPLRTMVLLAVTATVATMLLVPAFGFAFFDGSEPAVDVSSLRRTGALADELEVQVTVRDAEDLAAFEAALVFDPDVVSPTSVTLGEFVPAESHGLPPDDVHAGKLTLGSFNASGRTANGDGVLAVVAFERYAEGDPGFRLDPVRTGAFDTFGLRLDAKIGLAAPGAVFLPHLLTSGG